MKRPNKGMKLTKSTWDVQPTAGENRNEKRTEFGSQSSSDSRSELRRRIRDSKPKRLP